MDFFSRQDQARRRSRLLVFFFVAAIVGIVGVLYGAAILAAGPPWWQPEIFLGVTLLVLVVVGLGSLYKISQLAKGGSAVAELLGGKPIDPQTQDPRLRQLLNVVEEMAIASGVPVPRVYLLAEDSSINAFAAGHTVGDAVIGVTRGTLEQLNREELQGVIAHEFSHILNGDMRLNIRLMGILFGILCLAMLGQLLFRIGIYSRPRSNDKNAGAIVLVALGMGITLLLVGYVGVFFARLIQAAVSRQREFLADAAAVQFTRNPYGIAGALYKIAQSSSRLSSAHAAEASHMFFGNGVREAWLGLFSTHPPILERIQAIAPGFRPDAPKSTSSPPPLPGEGASQASTPRPWFGHAGAPQEWHLAQAAALLASLPATSTVAARELHGATALVYALLLDRTPEVQARQWKSLSLDEATRQEVEAHFQRRSHLSYEQEIALLDVAIATLRQLSPEQYRLFRQQVEALIAADGQIDLFEFLLERILVRHLDAYFQPRAKAEIRYHQLTPLYPDVATLLGAFALLADPPENRAPLDEAQQTYQAGLQVLGLNHQDPALVQPLELGVEAIGKALDNLGLAAPEIKRRVLEACGVVVMADGQVAERQGQLLRAVADALDCPVPLLKKN